MTTFRIALANLRFPSSPEESVALAEQGIARASAEKADLICFPECFVPGYRLLGKSIPPPNQAFLERALLVADLDLAPATGLLATRFRSP